MANLFLFGLRAVVYAAAFSALAVLPAESNEENTRGVIVIPYGEDREFELYENSHALLVGASQYEHWPALTSVPRELESVESMLSEQGFLVEKIMNPTAAQLGSAFESFINRHGYAPGNRLLFYFAGHGYTRSTEQYGDKGYIVPVDSALPQRDEAGFLSAALPMSQIMEWSRRIEAKHSLFVFDSCFSGSVFKTRALPDDPPHISAMTARPVVQFITAGSANDEVPASSVFTPAFVDALRHGRGDLNADGFVTGTELGLHLQLELPQYVRQLPQYGKHPDYERAQGDFVFVAGTHSQLPSPPPSQPPDEGPGPQLSEPDGSAGIGTLITSQGELVFDRISNMSMGAGKITVSKLGARVDISLEKIKSITFRDGNAIRIEYRDGSAEDTRFDCYWNLPIAFHSGDTEIYYGDCNDFGVVQAIEFRP